IAFAVLFVVLSFSTPAFLSARNLHNILDQSAQVGIISCAMTIAIISGNFDLSAGAVFALAGSVAALVAQTGAVELGILAGILVGLLLGLGNGVLISSLRIHSFIATLATSLVIRGLALVMTDGRLIIVDDPGFRALAQGTFLGIRYPVYILAAWVLFTGFLLARTTFGRAVYAIGGNPEAARLSGIQVEKVRIWIFGLSGLSAGLAGVIAVSRVAQGQADIGSMIELEAIARTVIGGTSIMGGEGAIWRTGFG